MRVRYHDRARAGGCHRYEIDADTEQCPQCVSILDKKTGLPCGLGKYDDGHHAACVCPHPVLNKMITDRHNAAVHKVADEIRNAHHEREWHLLVHAGTTGQSSAKS